MVKHKETESDSEGSSHAKEPRFRISVCMKQFYSDERARAYVCVSARRRVRWLQRRLQRLFALPPAFRLLSRGHLLPPDEPLALLERDDPVEVVPVRAELDETATARGVVDFVESETTVERLERSPSPVCADDLTETKRQALMMLEQYSVGPAAECAAECAAESAAESAARPRRRRVRRRRRAPAADDSRLAGGADDSRMASGADDSRLAGGAGGSRMAGGADGSWMAGGADGSRMAGGADGSRLAGGADGSRLAGGTDGSRLTGVADERDGDELDGTAAALPVLCEPQPVALVLRNDLQPRPPRVVRPLYDQVTPSLLITETLMG